MKKLTKLKLSKEEKILVELGDRLLIRIKRFSFALEHLDEFMNLAKESDESLPNNNDYIKTLKKLRNKMYKELIKLNKEYEKRKQKQTK